MGWTRIKSLGEGGYGSVCLARSSPTPDDIANGLNIPPLIAVKSAPFSTSESLKYEREVLHSLRDCPNVVKCYGADACFMKGGVIMYNIFLEYAAGGSLADRIYSSDPFGEEEIKDYTRSILRGLKYMHSMGIIHCDIKPANILLVVDDDNPGGGYAAKIADLGLALQQEKTNSEEFRGTLLYLAPESILYGHYGCGVDIWALGCTVAEMFARKRLRKFNAKFELKWEVIEQMAKQDVDIPLGISKDARDFLNKCLNIDPVLRWTADRLLKEHPFVCEADPNVEIRGTNLDDEWNVSSEDVDDEELNELMIPMKLLKRDREGVLVADLSDDIHPAFCKKPKLDHQVHKSAAPLFTKLLRGV